MIVITCVSVPKERVKFFFFFKSLVVPRKAHICFLFFFLKSESAQQSAALYSCVHVCNAAGPSLWEKPFSSFFLFRFFSGRITRWAVLLCFFPAFLCWLSAYYSTVLSLSLSSSSSLLSFFFPLLLLLLFQQWCCWLWVTWKSKT